MAPFELAGPHEPCDVPLVAPSHMAGVEVHEPAFLLRAPPEPFQEQAVSQVAVAFIAGRIAGDARPADAKSTQPREGTTSEVEVV